MAIFLSSYNANSAYMNCQRDTSFVHRTSSRRGVATMRTGWRRTEKPI